MRGDERAQIPSRPTAEDVPADVGGDAATGDLGRKLLRDVRERGREDARHHEALREAPGDQFADAARVRGAERDEREREDRGHDHALAADRIGERPDERRGECDRERQRGDRRGDGRLGRVEVDAQLR